MTAKCQTAISMKLRADHMAFIFFLLKEIEIFKSFLEIAFFSVLDLISGICVGRWGAEEERFMFFTAEVLPGKKSQGK